MSELQDMLRVQARLHRKQGANALGDLFDNASKEIESLSEQLAKANESALFYKEQYEKADRECTKLAMRESKANERVKELDGKFESQMTNDFVTITDQAKRIAELESYNLKLANESHKYQQRCSELDEIADTAFKYNHSSYQCLRAWNKLQQLRKEQSND